MAEIDIERKGPPVWPWILGLLALVLVVWGVVEYVQREQTGAPPPGVAVRPEAPPEPDRPVVGAAIQPAVEEYRSRCMEPESTRDTIDSPEEFVASCIRVLSGALASVIGRDTVGDVPLQGLLNGYREAAQRVDETGWRSPTEGDLARAVFLSAADIMRYVEETRQNTPPELRETIAEVRRAADAVEPATPIAEQRENTDRFFRRAGDAIELMAERDPSSPRT